MFGASKNKQEEILHKIDGKSNFEEFIPEVEVKIFSLKSKSVETLKDDNLLEYVLVIVSKNTNKVVIENLNLKFYFPYKIKSFVIESISSSNNGVEKSGFRAINHETGESVQQMPKEDFLGTCFLNIEKTKANDEVINSHILRFSSSKLFMGDSCLGRVIVNLKDSESLLVNKSKIGFYEGSFVYSIDNHTYREHIRGQIPKNESGGHN